MDENIGELILNKESIDMKLRRMAYEIWERNAEERELVIAGILDRGMVVARHIANILKEIAAFKLTLINLQLDRERPQHVAASQKLDFTGKAVIVVDDVANSGRTMLYSIKPLLDFLPRSIQTAVLVDRMHKAFPVVINYIGYSLSTTLQENIRVDVRGNEICCVYLS